MKEKKRYTPPRSYKEQKEMHVKILIGAILVAIVIVVISIFLTNK